MRLDYKILLTHAKHANTHIYNKTYENILSEKQFAERRKGTYT